MTCGPASSVAAAHLELLTSQVLAITITTALDEGSATVIQCLFKMNKISHNHVWLGHDPEMKCPLRKQQAAAVARHHYAWQEPVWRLPISVTSLMWDSDPH